jgi:hypothetical protein
MTAPHALLALYVAVMIELVALAASFVGLLVLLRVRHTGVWRSLGSPSVGYMQSLFSPRPPPLVTYIRRRGYRELSDPLTQGVGAFANFQLRYGAWAILALCAVAAWVLYRWSWPNAT